MPTNEQTNTNDQGGQGTHAQAITSCNNKKALLVPDQRHLSITAHPQRDIPTRFFNLLRLY